MSEVYKKQFEELFKYEKQFLIEEEYPTNEHGVFIFESADKSTKISLDGVLRAYKDWLVENDIIKILKD